MPRLRRNGYAEHSSKGTKGTASIMKLKKTLPIHSTFIRAACILFFTALPLIIQAAPRQTMRIEFMPPDQFKTLTTVTDTAHLVKTLRHEGAAESTSITIGIQEDTGENTMAAIVGQLFQAGFRHVMFARPKKVVSTVGSITNQMGINTQSGVSLSGNSARIPSDRENQLRKKNQTGSTVRP